MRESSLNILDIAENSIAAGASPTEILIKEDTVKPWGEYKRKREHKRIKEGYYEQDRKQSTRGDNLISKEE